MNLNLTVIEHELQGHVWLHGSCRAPGELPIECAEVYVEGCSPVDGVAYIVPEENTRNLKAQKQGHFICLGVPCEDVLARNEVIYTEEPVNVLELLNEVSRVFQKYRHWERELERIFIDGEDIRKIGEVSYPFFNNPIYFMDMHYWVFFFKCVLDESVPKPRWDHYLAHDALCEGAYMSLDEITELRSDQQFDYAIESVGPTIFDGNLVDFRTLYHNTFVEGENVARFCVDEIVHPFEDYDFAITQALGDWLGKHYFNGAQAQVRYRLSDREILDPLLEGKQVSETGTSMYLRELGWSPSDTFTCFVADTIPGNDAMVIDETLARHIAIQCSCMCHTIRAAQFVMVFNVTRQWQNEDFSNKILPVLRDNLLIVGQSMDIVGFSGLRYGYIQAVAALEFGSKKDPSAWRHVFRHCELEYIFGKALEDQPVELLAPQGLKRLMKSDREKGTHDVGLLQAYLENERNVTKASRAVFMQRSSFYYRLNNAIYPTLDMNLDDESVRLLLIVVMRMLNGPDSKS